MKCDTCKGKLKDFCKTHEAKLALIDVNECNDYNPKPSQIFKVNDNKH